MAGEGSVREFVASAAFIVLIWIFFASGIATAINFSKLPPIAYIGILLGIFAVLWMFKK